MPVMSAFANQTMTAEAANPLLVQSAPIAMGQNTRLDVASFVRSIFATGGTPSLALTVQASNDAVEWLTLAAGAAYNGTGLHSLVQDVEQAYVRVTYEFTIAGTPGDWGAVCFDSNLNLMHK